MYNTYANYIQNNIYIKLDLDQDLFIDPYLYIKQQNGDPWFPKTYSASQPPEIQLFQQDR